VSEMRLAGFRDLLADIAAQLKTDVRLPMVDEAVQRALELDRFCADVDQMIGINLLTSGERKLFGTEVASAAERQGMSLQSDGTFHLLDAQGATLFNLSASDGTTFQHHTLNQSRVDRLTLLLDIPRVSEPVRCFDEMVALANELAKTLRTTLADDQRVALSDGAIAQIRSQVAATEDLMLVGHITPGSAQALRLFS
jgi:FtsZ-interacting cell division protein ZipA